MYSTKTLERDAMKSHGLYAIIKALSMHVSGLARNLAEHCNCRITFFEMLDE